MSNSIDPTRQQFDMFKNLPRDTPIMMMNLIRLRDEAQYPDGRNASGVQAYKSYGEESGPIFKRVGGEIIWRGEPECLVIGPLEEAWDIAFIARYPNTCAFLDMITDAVYKQVVFHRQAAVLDSRLIRLGEAIEGSGFAG
jgi:uncharacterized protein (DUF1330 family)